ncbi:winged helix-turn-helix transcriptional regulator, partial [Halomonas sp. TRM85114]|uniref:winged helix-turn-helix domain-containing protein n=1 Tax=Halomonas jincaotanensis TaxID=2810616 RepID=UPI001BD1FB17
CRAVYVRRLYLAGLNPCPAPWVHLSPRSILSVDQIKDRLYGMSDEVESNALNVHIHHLRRKLGPGVVETVRGLGYRLGDPRAIQPPGVR